MAGKKNRKGGWRCPPGGWEYANEAREVRGRVLQLRVLMPRGATGRALNLAPVMRTLATLLGEHEVPILVGEVRGSAWESDLPWRQTRSGFQLRMPISQLVQPRIVDQIARHAVTGPIYCVERGRGDARRVVWMLSGGSFTI